MKTNKHKLKDPIVRKDPLINKILSNRKRDKVSREERRQANMFIVSAKHWVLSDGIQRRNGWNLSLWSRIRGRYCLTEGQQNTVAVAIISLEM